MWCQGICGFYLQGRMDQLAVEGWEGSSDVLFGEFEAVG